MRPRRGTGDQATEIAATIHEPDEQLQHRIIEVSTHQARWAQLFGMTRLAGLGAARTCFVDTTEIALEMAATGSGIALARAPASDHSVRAHGLQRRLDGAEVKGDEAYHLIYRSPIPLWPAARRFRDWLLEQSAAFR